MAFSENVGPVLRILHAEHEILGQRLDVVDIVPQVDREQGVFRRQCRQITGYWLVVDRVDRDVDGCRGTRLRGASVFPVVGRREHEAGWPVVVFMGSKPNDVVIHIHPVNRSAGHVIHLEDQIVNVGFGV